MNWMKMIWAKVIQTVLSAIKHVADALYKCNEEIIQRHSFTSVRCLCLYSVIRQKW